MIHDNAFDSAYYGLKIGKLAISNAAELRPALQEARSRAYTMLVVRIDANDRGLLRELAAVGHAPLETLVTLTLRAGPAPAAPVASVEHRDTLDPIEADAVAQITAEAVAGTHLHKDPRLPLETTRRLYAAWARNDVTGRAQRTIVARDGRDIIGYLSVLRDDVSAVIDLIAVQSARHGRGTGSALLASFLRWTHSENLCARVGTQSDNPALALYKRFGFEPTQQQCTYHLWLDD